jgi:FkbM family methyltransferase
MMARLRSHLVRFMLRNRMDVPLNRLRAGIRARQTAGGADGPLHVNTAGNVQLFLDPVDPRAQALAAAGGTMDRSLIKAWQRLMKDFRPDCLVDVGANYGEVAFATSLTALREVHLVEPNPTVAACLRQTVLASMYRHITVHECAASREAGHGLLQTGLSSGVSRLELDHGIASGGDKLVRICRIDDIIPRFQGRLLMKIDVEGHELEVLQGAVNALTTSEDFAILCEYVHLSAEQLAFLGARFQVDLLERLTGTPVAVDLASGGDGIQLHRENRWAIKDILLRRVQVP